MYTNRFKNQENGDCLLHWSVNIAEEDDTDRTVDAVAGFDVIMKLPASGLAVLFGPVLSFRRIQRPTVRLKEQLEMRSFEILTAFNAAVTAFWDMKTCNLANTQSNSGGTIQLTSG